MHLLLLLGCVHTVDISVRAAVVGPADWDGLGLAAPVIQEVAVPALASMDPLVGIAAGGAAQAIGGYAPPDPRGAMVLWYDGVATGPVAPVPTVENTFTPVWAPGQARLTAVRLDRRVAVQVGLEDYDPLNENDPIANVLVPSAELRAAFRSRQPRWIAYAETTGGKLVKLAVEVSRTP